MSVFKPEFLAILNELEEAAFMKGHRAARFPTFDVGSNHYKENEEQFRKYSADTDVLKRKLTDLVFENKG